MSDELAPQPDETFGAWLVRVSQAISPADYATAALGRDRPYNGQPQTPDGERGATELRGITMRDVKDCFVMGAFEAAGIPREDWPVDVYGLPWNDMDPIAVALNMLCNIERRMGIYPNVPSLEQVEP